MADAREYARLWRNYHRPVVPSPALPPMPALAVASDLDAVYAIPATLSPGWLLAEGLDLCAEGPRHPREDTELDWAVARFKLRCDELAAMHMAPSVVPHVFDPDPDPGPSPSPRPLLVDPPSPCGTCGLCASCLRRELSPALLYGP